MYSIHKKLLALLWLTYFLNYVDRQVIFSMLPAIRSEIPMTNMELGWIGSLFIWLYSLASPLGGRLADRCGSGPAVFASVLLFSGATLLTGISQTAAMLLAGRALLGITESLYFPSAVALLGSTHDPSVRSRAISIHGSAQFAGAATGAWFGGWMAEQFGWRSSFWCLAAAGLAWAAVIGATVWKQHGRPTGASGQAKEASRLSDLYDPRYGVLLGAFFAYCAMLWMLYAWLPLFLQEKFKLSLSAAGLQASIFLQAGSILGILGGGVLGDRVGRRYRDGRMMLASGGILIMAPFAITILIAPELWMVAAASVCCGLFAGLMGANYTAAAYDIVAERSYGLAAGVLTLVGGLAGGLAILFAGAWKDTFGIPALMQVAAAAAAVSAILLAITVWTYSHRLTQHENPAH